jgi:hypothetical protein
MLTGYAAEYKLRKVWFSGPHISNLVVPDDHDRTMKYDMGFDYKGVAIRVEVKSLQTNSVKVADSTARSGWRGLKSAGIDPFTVRKGNQTAIFQCDASDKRTVHLPSGATLDTTCLLIDAFDIIAVGLFAFGNGWKFAFARNRDLPHTAKASYSREACDNLLASSMPITWPLHAPYEPDPFGLLDGIVKERKSRGRS